MADEIQRLREALAEAHRQRQQAERTTAEERRRREEAERSARITAQRAADDKRDAESANILLRSRLAEIDQSRRDLEGGQRAQTLHEYLALASRMHAHLSRFIPRALPPAPPQPSGSSTSSKPTTTGGQTSVHGKYYPLRLRPWPDFPQLQRDALSRLRTAVGTSRTFPSRLDVQSSERSLMRSVPVEFLQTAAILNEQKTSMFLDLTLEKPSSLALGAYLTATGTGKMIFFDNLSAGIATAGRPLREPIDGTATTAVASRPRPPAKTIPDCVVMSSAVGVSQTAGESCRVLVGEHKPCHALRGADLSGAVLPEDYLVRLAITTESRRRKRDSTLLASVSTSPGQSPPVPDSSVITPKRSYFASALAQAYHYMLMSGLEFGYVASGETLSCLRIPAHDPTSLLYHSLVFPVPTPEDLPRLDNGSPEFPGPLTVSNASLDADPHDEEAFTALPISELCGLCILALDSPPRDSDWVGSATGQLAAFPSLPRSLVRARDAGPSPLGVRRRDTADDGDRDEDRDGDADNQYSGGTQRGRSRLAVTRNDGGRQPSPLQQPHPIPTHTATAATGNGTSVPTAVSAHLDYCTQACLLGLARGWKVDPRCPNSALHVAASTEAQQQEQLHPIELARVGELVLEQMRRRVTENCVSLYRDGGRGAVGYLIKVALTGYGYTFVAKGVEAWNAGRLAHETRIYRRLWRLQGTLIPVHLGLVQLDGAYPIMEKFTALPHLMLMSHAGIPLHYEQLPAVSERVGRDLAKGVAEAYRELESWGVDDDDEDVLNATWCDETQRVMKIDFDHAYVDEGVYRQKLLALEDAERTHRAGERTGAKRRASADGPLPDDTIGKRVRPTREAVCAGVEGDVRVGVGEATQVTTI